MNDAEIIKALECCCTTKGGGCKECPLNDYEDTDVCQLKVTTEAYKLIQRQQAEIEGLQFDISELSKRIITLTDEKIRIASQRDEYLHRLALGVAWDNKPIVITSSELTNNVLSIACNNAIKEFAEKLKEKSCNHLVEYDEGGWSEKVSAVKVDDIDNLVKQMTGGEDDV